MKLLITGGHSTPALAVIDELQKTRKDVQILFVGRKYTSDTKREESLEYKEITKRKIPFIHLKTGRLSRVFAFSTVVHIVKIPLGFYRAYRILKKNKPERILSFGGYIALPIAIAGALLQIPVYTHEQTIQPGIANKIIARFARKVFLSFDESKKYFRKRNILVSGNPIRSQALEVVKKPFIIKSTKKILYITGGSLGSHSINNHIEVMLEKLLENYIVIHQVGNVKEYNDYDRLLQLQKKLPEDLRKRYYIREHFSSDEIGYIYNIADIVIGRSGANTFFELLALKKPAIFIPLPWSSHHEQQKQAELFKKWGVGEVFNQEDSSEKLFESIETVLKNIQTYRNNFETIKFAYERDATKTIIKTVVG